MPAGEDDVELHGAEHIALVLLSTHSLRRFLAAAYEVVPPGAEHRLLDLDTELAGILDETA
nr:hypothetical protein [Streptomyces sp. NBRC 110468]